MGTKFYEEGLALIMDKQSSLHGILEPLTDRITDLIMRRDSPNTIPIVFNEQEYRVKANAGRMREHPGTEIRLLSNDLPDELLGEIAARECVPPCPYCGYELRTSLAKQCFTCGKDWH